MKNFKINYKDHLGRKNSAQSSGKDEDQAIGKFETLYPDCKLQSTEEVK